MKTIIYIVLNLIFVSAFAQKAKENNAVIEYRIHNNTDIPNSLNASLFVNKGVTIYLPKYSTQVNDNQTEERKQNKRIIPDWRYLKIDHKKKEILSFETLGFNLVLVKDDYNNLKWNITEEKKAIGNYQCTKATTSYRGMDWIVWFTPDIALPYGPWKLHGLPGLIIEAHDAGEKFTWVVEKIEYKRDAIFDKEFVSLVETSNKEPMSQRQSIEQQDEFEANMEAEMRQANPGMGESVKVSRGGYELKYEWEQ